MRIAADTLFLPFAISSIFIEIISSEPKTLEDLFPGYKGVMPPARVSFSEQLPRNFGTFADRTMTPGPLFLVKRDHIIFGYLYDGFVRDPCHLFTQLENVFIVFDMNGEKWVSLSCDLQHKLGTNRFYAFLIARDEVAATHRLTSNEPVYREAHIRAVRVANHQVDIVERLQTKVSDGFRMRYTNGSEEIKRVYSEEYNRAFTLYLHHHGEYSIDGQKEMHD